MAPDEVIPVAPVMAPAPVMSMVREFRMLPRVLLITMPSVISPAVSKILIALVIVPAAVFSIKMPLVAISSASE